MQIAPLIVMYVGLGLLFSALVLVLALQFSAPVDDSLKNSNVGTAGSVSGVRNMASANV